MVKNIYLSKVSGEAPTFLRSSLTNLSIRFGSKAVTNAVVVKRRKTQINLIATIFVLLILKKVS
jgi:hypothetical protein